MPARRRAREANRKMRHAVDEAVARDRAAFQAAVQSGRVYHLEDIYWREHEEGGWCCIDCSPNHPAHLLAQAEREIEEHLAASVTPARVRRVRHASGVRRSNA